ncbi:MAG: methyltransferase domain-containing protein [Candidatus Methylacidiphilales bacterium]
MSQESTYRMVNLGCGAHFHTDWENYDLTPLSASVRPLDMSKPLPFEDATVDVVYASHVMEHMPRSRVPWVLSQMRRILKPDGVIRLVVPDLEAIARGYLSFLDAARRGEGAKAEAGHEWMTLELLDQMTRVRSGGFMARIWRTNPFLAKDLVGKRFGRESLGWIQQNEASFAQGAKPLSRTEVYEEEPITQDEKLAFWATGENHLWMYDEVSLGRLLLDAGFSSPRAVGATESVIPNYASYLLDTHPDGGIRKPDSLFMEAGGNPLPKPGALTRWWNGVRSRF